MRALGGVRSSARVERGTSNGRALWLATTVIAGLGASLGAGHAYAASWTGAVSTDWNTAGNWSPGAVPNNGAAVVINGNQGTAAVVSAAGDTAQTVSIGTAAGQAGALTIAAGGGLTTGTLSVGPGGGVLTVQGGGALTTAAATVSAAAGATSTAAVTGAGSVWTPSSLAIGGAGTSSLTLSNTAQMTDLGDLIVNGAGASNLILHSGAVLTQGNGPVGNNAGTGNFTIADDATGSMLVDTGGQISTRFSVVGSQAGSNGTVTVEDAGSLWTIRAGADFGYQGAASLFVLNGGHVDVAGATAGAYFGFDTGSTGAGMVSGTGSLLSIGAGLTVGNSGTGGLTVQNGGAVTVGGATSVGSAFSLTYAPGVGTLTVTGAGSTLSTKGFNIGTNGGGGTVNILAGGVITATAPVAIATGVLSGGVEHYGTGSLTVSGAGSALSASNTIDVGARNQGSLTISAGGHVGDTSAYVGSYKNTSGSYGVGVATVTGAGSTWNNTGFIRVGDGGNGSLNVLAGAAVTDTTATIAYAATSTSAATVDGAGSTWTSSGDVTLARGGAGGLTLSNSGAIYAGGSGGTGILNIAFSAGSTGVLNIGAAQTSAAAAAGEVYADHIAFGAGTGSVVFNHTSSNYLFAPAITGAGAVVVQAGTTTLSGSNTYSGATSVNGGTLLVTGSLASPTVTVASGGTLGGTGTLTGATTVANGGALTGAAGALFTLGALTLNNTSQLDVSLGAPSTTALFDVTGNLALDGVLNVTDAGGFGVGLYRIIDYGGALTDNGLAVGATPAGVSQAALTVQTSVAGQVNLIFAVAPLQFWNGANTSPTGAIGGGAGTWSLATTNWTDSTGSTASTWGGSDAVFTGAPGAVTIDNTAGAITADSLQFASTGYTVGGGALTLTGATPTIRVGDGTIQGAAITAVISAPIAGAGGLIKTDLGTLVLSGANTYTGGTTIAGGVLSVSADANLGVASGGITFNGGSLSASSSFTSARNLSFPTAGGIGAGAGATLNLTGVLSGPGAFTKSGAGIVTLSGNSAGYAGPTTVAAGTLQVNGILGGAMTVQSGARLQGIGQVGAATIAAGATLAPGNSIGALTVAGPITFASGSFYETELNAAGASDLTHATGVATINGGTVQALPASGQYGLGTRYTILTADGGRSGTFAGLTSTTLTQPFLAFGLAYDATHAYLDVVRNGVSYCSVSASANECAAANGAESLAQGNSVYNAIANLPDVPSARAAFDSLSGEIHASDRAAQLEDSRFVRDAALGRLSAAGDGNVIWAQGFGAGGSVDSDGNAAHLNHRLGGVLMGVDGMAGDHWRVGALAGYSQTRLDISDRRSSSDSDNYHVAAYAGAASGPFAASFGAAYTWADQSIDRAVAFGAFSDHDSAGVKAQTGQLFGEIAWRLGSEVRRVEPYADLAYVVSRQGDFNEAGGAAALHGSGGSSAVTFGTIGVRGQTTWTDNGMTTTLGGRVGWRGATGDTTPDQTLAFRSGGAAFTVAGAPIADSALVLRADLTTAVTARTKLSVSYDGQIAKAARDNGVKLALTIGF